MAQSQAHAGDPWGMRRSHLNKIRCFTLDWLIAMTPHTHTMMSELDRPTPLRCWVAAPPRASALALSWVVDEECVSECIDGDPAWTTTDRVQAPCAGRCRVS